MNYDAMDPLFIKKDTKELRNSLNEFSRQKSSRIFTHPVAY